jgi:hypothetical protein
MTLTLGAMAPKRRSNANGGIRGLPQSSFFVLDVVDSVDFGEGSLRISGSCNEAVEN